MEGNPKAPRIHIEHKLEPPHEAFVQRVNNTLIFNFINRNKFFFPYPLHICSLNGKPGILYEFFKAYSATINFLLIKTFVLDHVASS